jgi:tRNA A37 threonylcarbamoyladenosine synthetase subunit TsaC/SUA5/YrdC
MTNPFDYLNALAALQAPDGVILLATDAGFYLGCLPDHPEALRRMLTLQPYALPVTLFSHSREAMSPYIGDIGLLQAAGLQPLMKAHWPGLLTCEVPIKPGALTLEDSVIWIRIPDYPFLTEFTQMLPGQVLAAVPVSGPISGGRLYQLEANCPVHADFRLQDANSASQPHEDTVVRVSTEGQVVVVHPGSLRLSLG